MCVCVQSVNSIFTHAGLCSSDHCRVFLCSSFLSVCCVTVSYTIVSCNRAAQTAASQRSPVPLPGPVPTWRRCHRHGSVPLQAAHHLSMAHCVNEGLRGGKPANWGSSNYCGCPLPGCLDRGKGGGAFPPV